MFPTDAGLRKTVALDDGPCEVRVLGLYELDRVPYDDPGEFEYDYQISDNQITKKAYTLKDWAEPPEKPTTPKELCEHGSYEWAMWNAYDLYQAVYDHHLKQIEATEARAHDVARYVIANCLAEADRGRITTPERLDKILLAALVEEETAEDLARAMANTFQIDLGWSAYL